MVRQPFNYNQGYALVSDGIERIWKNLTRSFPEAHAIDNHIIAGDLINAVKGGTLGEPDVVQHLLQWRKYGMPTFRLTNGLAAGLILTDPGKIPWSEVGMPFPSFEITVPPGIIFFDDADGTTLEGTTITVTTMDFIDRREDVHRIFRTIKAMEERGGITAPLMTQFISEIRQVDSSRAMMIRLASNVFPSAGLYYKTPPLKPGLMVDDIFGLHGDNEANLTTRDQAASVAMARIVVNLAMYLRGHDDKEQPVWTPRSKPQGRPSRPGNTTMWEVGHSVKLPNQVRATARAFTEEAGRKTWKLHARYIVRGHQSHYWYGPKNQPEKRERRSRWIMPFWRGPEGGASVPKLYEVDTKK